MANEQYPLKKINLHAPSLEELSQVLNEGLSKFFEQTEVSVVQCPDLKLSPFNLAQTGLCGNEKIVDVGGPPYLIPTPNLDKKFSFEKISSLIGLPKAFLIGPGCGPHEVVGVNSELMANVYIENHVSITNKTHYAKIVDGNCHLFTMNCTQFSLMANFLATEGLPGPVLKVVAKKRISNKNFTNSMRQILHEKYGTKPVSLGGVFLIKSGKARLHVMPDFSKTPLLNDEQVTRWLNYFEMNSPLICLSVFHSYDPGFDLRIEHTHCFSEHGEGGHYHYDVTPDQVEYEGYFNVGKELYRVDAPAKSHDIGRD